MLHTKAELLRRVDSVNTWRKAGVRAPHKPLLILLALGLFSRGKRDAVLFTEIEDQLRFLLREYGPPRSQVHPEYPFWRLQKDSLWQVEADDHMKLRGDRDDPRVTELRRCRARGFFPAWIVKLLERHPGLLQEAVARVLSAHFPQELHHRIAHDIQIPITHGARAEDSSDASFKSSVLRAYSSRCALTGFALRQSGNTYGIEAAYIKWPQAGGPSRVSNGIAMTHLHADLFLRGILTITTDYEVCIVESAELTPNADSMLTPLLGKRISLPATTDDWPDPRFLRWHYREVYRGAPITI